MIDSSTLLPDDDSFYLYDRSRFRSSLARFADAFRAVYPKVELALSVKTNYLPDLLRDALDLGCRLEVVSAMEYRMARAQGAEPARIVVNGPAKGRELVVEALLDGALVQLDAPAEIPWVAEAARSRADARPLRIALRAHVASAVDSPSRFGFASDTAELTEGLAALRALPGVDVVGLSAHVCTPTRSAADYRTLARELVRLGERHFEAGPELLNLGGGFLSEAPAALCAQFPFAWSSFADYAAAIGDAFAISAGAAGSGRSAGSPLLLLEPGLAVDAAALGFVTRVVGIRELGGVELVQVAGSVFDLKPTRHGKNLPVTRLATGGAPVDCRGARIVGHTCMEDDLLFEGFRGPLAVGDRLLFEQVGAYTLVLRPPFISVRPAVYAEDVAGGELRRIEPPGDWRCGFDFRPRAARPG